MLSLCNNWTLTSINELRHTHKIKVETGGFIVHVNRKLVLDLINAYFSKGGPTVYVSMVFESPKATIQLKIQYQNQNLRISAAYELGRVYTSLS